MGMADASGSDESIETSSTQSFSTPASPAAASEVVANRGITPLQQTQGILEIEDDEEASDASMSADSDDSDDDAGIIIQANPSVLHMQTSTSLSAPAQGIKRKLSTNSEAVLPVSQTDNFDHPKKMKMDSGLTSFWTSDGRLKEDRSLLPAEIWHHIFTFVPPKALGRLLRVNKGFNAYLNPTSPHKPPSLALLSKSATSLRQPEFIWQASRRLYRPGVPSPLEGFTELEMWRFACSTTCESCGKQSKAMSSAPVMDPWHAGPGANGVRPIWLFKLRSCGPCLEEYSIKEIELLLSSSVPSPLMAAVPFVFLTNEQHVISASTLSSGQQPAAVQITKYYLKAAVEDIKQEFFKVKGMGTGTAEEWLKGLEARGKDWRNEASRWERWEQTGGVLRMRTNEAAELLEVISKAPVAIPSEPNVPLKNHSAGANGTEDRNLASNIVSRTVAPLVPQLTSTVSVAYGIPSAPSYSGPLSNPALVGPFQPRYPQGRQERTKEEVIELKAARKAEIERRCLSLDPPITPGVLGHMASFQAALQIIKPFDENAWALLKPRLLAQRDEAEQREQERLAHTRAVQTQVELRRIQDEQNKESKENVDQEWENAQDPLRAKIANYADQIIRDGWAGGQRVNHKTSPQFAAEVLLYVRNRFYAENAGRTLSDPAPGKESQDGSISDPLGTLLTLETMKWLFDAKLRPLAETHRKELFLCRVCEVSKFYGFEGVIQHYAAKHTSALSLGSIVVNWRAEWPEQPPFNPKPLNDNSGGHTAEMGSSSFDGVNISTSNFTVHVPTSQVSLLHAQNQSGYPQPQPQYYGAPQYPTPYAPTPSEQYMAEQAIHPTYPPNVNASYAQYQSSAADYSQALNAVQYPASGHTNYDVGPDRQHNADSGSTQFRSSQPMQSGAPASHFFPPSTPKSVADSHHASVQQPGTVRTEEYRSRLLDVARTASSVWKSTSGVKEMSGSVRVYVIIFHILKEFRDKYDDDPPLTMIIDGLSNNKDMRPVRNINGLACRACKLEENYLTNTHSRPLKGAKAPEKKLLSFPQLLNHFQAIHIAAVDGPPQYDWGTDMVELPNKKKISSLSRVQGMDEYKLELVKEALPLSFIETPPPSNYMEQDNEYQQYQQPTQNYVPEFLPPSEDNHDKYYSQNRPSQAPSPKESLARRHRSPMARSRDNVNQTFPDSKPPNDNYASSAAPAPRNPELFGGLNDDCSHNKELLQAPQREAPEDTYLEGPRYYSTAANLSELLANPSLHTQRSRAPVTSTLAAQTSGNVASTANFPAVAPTPLARNTAEQFLHDFDPGEDVQEYYRKMSQIQVPSRNARYEEITRPDSWNARSQTTEAKQQRYHGVYEDEYVPPMRSSETNRQAPSFGGQELYEGSQKQRPFLYEYDEPYDPRFAASPSRQERIDYRLEPEEEIIYVDQHGRRVPPPAPRYTQLERPGGLRLRSRSPMTYADQSNMRYRDHDHGPRISQPDSFRTRTPHTMIEEVQYERPSRQNNPRSYEEATQRHFQYEEQAQYLPASSNVDYIVRRPGVPEHEYSTYDDREVIYERNPPPLRPGTGAEIIYEDEEYDPRNPAPLPPQLAARQGRYQ